MKVLTIAAYPTIQYGLRAAVEEDPFVEVVGAMTEFADLSTHGEVLAPDVILADVDWHPDDLLDMREALRAIPMLLLVESADAGVEALSHGVQGVLLRDAEGPAIVAGLRAVKQGLIVLDPRIQILTQPEQSTLNRGKELMTESLSPREVEVLELIARGLTNRGIALELGISEHTVKFHVGSILGKLGAGSRSEALARAMAAGLISV